MRQANGNPGGRVAKRAFDLCVGGLLALATLPLMAVIGLLVWRQLGAPVLFRHERPGLNGKLFTMYKFRTMREARDAEGRPLPDAQRLTRLGRFLRSTSLDELPEFINVLRGDMSLVGPRPLLKEYLPFYRERERLRHSVRPGITGWAQVNGRNFTPWDRRLELDAWYAENRTLLLDLRILALTLSKVVRREGVAVDTDTVGLPLHVERSAQRTRGPRPKPVPRQAQDCVDHASGGASMRGRTNEAVGK